MPPGSALPLLPATGNPDVSVTAGKGSLEIGTRGQKSYLHVGSRCTQIYSYPPVPLKIQTSANEAHTLTNKAAFS